MKKNKLPHWVLLEIADLQHQGVDIYDWNSVTRFLEGQNRFTMLEWIQDNRRLFIYSVLSNKYRAL